MITLEIDNREPSDIKNNFTLNDCNISGFKCNLKNLEQGDFLIKDTNDNLLILIERKSINDLISSVKDNRYLEQSDRYNSLELSNSKIYYIIEGNIDNYDTNSIEYKTYYSCIYSLSYKKEFSIIISKNILDTINWIKQFIYRIVENKESTSSKTNLIKKQIVNQSNVNEYMLNVVPGIGLTTSKQILKYFDCNLNMMINKVKEDPEILNNIKISDKNVKERKLNKKVIENIKNYLVK